MGPSPPITQPLEITMKKLVAALIGMFILAGCNTMAGIGEDTQAAGRSLEKSAEKNKNYRP
jgi:predicted small secreted protein